MIQFERDKYGNLVAVDENGKRVGTVTTSDGPYEEKQKKEK